MDIFGTKFLLPLELVNFDIFIDNFLIFIESLESHFRCILRVAIATNIKSFFLTLEPKIPVYGILDHIYIYRRGSIITCQVQKHGTEILEVEVWEDFMTCSKNDGAKPKTLMHKMNTDV